MNELALFAGAGGGLLGSHVLGWRTVCAVELAPYARDVLLARQRDGFLPRFPWPALREWMMGWPIGWTALEPLATAKWLAWLLWHTESLRGEQE